MNRSAPSLYHLSMSLVRRSLGRSSVSASAYRSASQMTDLRTGVVVDHRRKQHVTPLMLIFPNASSECGREEFWNSIELHCRRRDAVVARELDAALPLGLSQSLQISLVMKFSTWISNEFQVVVDGNLHAKPNNPHVDLLISANAIGPDGKIGKKARGLDGIATRMAKGPNAVERIRAKWAEICNQVLEAAGRPERLDHRSYKRQGIDRIPTIHLGRAVHALEKSSPGSTEVGRRLAAIKAENERIQGEEGNVRNERKPRKPRRPRKPKSERECRARRPRPDRQPKAERRPRRAGLPVEAYLSGTPEAVAGSGLPLPGSMEHGRAVPDAVRESGVLAVGTGTNQPSEGLRHQGPTGGVVPMGGWENARLMGKANGEHSNLASTSHPKRGVEIAAPAIKSDPGGSLARVYSGHALGGVEPRIDAEMGDRGHASTLGQTGPRTNPCVPSESRPGSLVGMDQSRTGEGRATSRPGNPSADGRRAPRASASRERNDRSAELGRHRSEPRAAQDRVDHPSGGPLRGGMGRRDISRELGELDQILGLEIASINFESEHTVVLSRKPRLETHPKDMPIAHKPGKP